MSEDNAVTRVEFTSLVDRVARNEIRVDVCEADRISIRGDMNKFGEKLQVLEHKTDAQTIILERLDKLMSGLFADPRARLLAQMVVGALVAWMASKGVLAK